MSWRAEHRPPLGVEVELARQIADLHASLAAVNDRIAEAEAEVVPWASDDEREWCYWLADWGRATLLRLTTP